MIAHDVFAIFQQKIEEQGVKITQILIIYSHRNINLHEGVPKLTILINHEEWYIEDIQWEIINQVIFQASAADQWWKFPFMIKTLLSYLARDLNWRSKIFYLNFSWMESKKKKKKFFQPYQIRYLKETDE
jgi:hypothetical protein